MKRYVFRAIIEDEAGDQAYINEYTVDAELVGMALDKLVKANPEVKLENILVIDTGAGIQREKVT